MVAHDSCTITQVYDQTFTFGVHIHSQLHQTTCSNIRTYINLTNTFKEQLTTISYEVVLTINQHYISHHTHFTDWMI